MSEKQRYIPALRFQSLTGIYDKVISVTLREEVVRSRLIDQAQLRPGMRVLDMGSGTGSFLTLLKQRHPEVEAIGLDGDPAVLAIAKAKAVKQGLAVRFDKGYATAMPYGESSFDAVFSTLVFHHLTSEQKRKALSEIKRVLKPDGKIHIADWGLPHDPFMRLLFYSIQLLDGFETTSGNVRQGLVPFMVGSGFKDAIETHRERTVYGTLSYYIG